MDILQQQATQAIHAAGGRMTPQRRLLLDLLQRSARQLDAEQLYELARQQDSKISLATVYRTLHALTAAGLIQERYLSQDHDRKYYETLNISSGYLFTCRACNRVIPFQSEIVHSLHEQLEQELGVLVMQACACFSGLCPECRQQKENAK